MGICESCFSEDDVATASQIPMLQPTTAKAKKDTSFSDVPPEFVQMYKVGPVLGKIN